MAVDREISVPLYLQIRDALRSEILEGRYLNKSLPGELDLVERFGVSRGTVRQALRSLEQLGMLKRERGRGTFALTTSRPPHSQVSSPITAAIIVPHLRGSVVPTLLLGVESVTRKRGARLVFNQSEQSQEIQSKVLEEVRNSEVSGIILFPVDAGYRDPVLQQMISDGYPVVLVDRYIRGLNLDYVTSDGYGGMLQAVQHLLGIGHRRIGFITWNLHQSGQFSRFLGYRQALLDWGIEPDANLVCEMQELPVESLEPLEQFLQGSHRPTAVVTLNDYLATQVFRVARRLGLSIPKDLALIGFDDIDVDAQMDVPLTSVSQPIFEMGSRVAELLLEKISAPQRDTQRVILTTHLVIRESCGRSLKNTKAFVDQGQMG
jgi:GntR family transcriptional regulator, arabinose operon transcriptional repressor